MEKVLVVGIDSLDPKIFSEIKDDLPNFHSLHVHELQTTIPPETPVAWSAAATGCNPGKYGIYDFINRDPQTYLPKLNLVHEKRGIIKTDFQSAMQGIPYWRTLTRSKIPVTILRWPVTFPPEKINGNMLSGLGVVDIKNLLNSYSFYTDDPKYTEGNVLQVKVDKGIIKTDISGPIIKKKGEMQDVKAPMQISLDEKVEIKISNDVISIKPGMWSPLIRIKFKVYSFLEVSGICQMYLQSINPFKMYVSSVQIDPENQLVPITYPKGYGNELAQNIGLFYTLGMAEDVNAVKEGNLPYAAFLEQIGEIEKQREEMFWYEFNKFKGGVYTCVFDAGDRLKHIFWDNKIFDGSEDFIISPEIKKYYIDKDKMLGKVISKLNNNTKLIVMSDHGFTSFERQVNINSWLVKEGYMKVRDKEKSLLRFVDWNNTKAYSLGFTSVYINQKGREAEGIVSEDEKEELINEIIAKLK
jgi:predicted AlkP superfamily phosphohydrolase/phosphomutase